MQHLHEDLEERDEIIKAMGMEIVKLCAMLKDKKCTHANASHGRTDDGEASYLRGSLVPFRSKRAKRGLHHVGF